MKQAKTMLQTSMFQTSMFHAKGRTIVTAMVIIAWSSLMFLLGSLAPEFGISQSQAATQNPVVRLDLERLGGNNLGEFEPYEPEFGDLLARGHEYFYSEDGNFGIGVWESKPGKMTMTDLEYDELMYVLDGSIVLIDEDGASQTYGPGEGLVLAQGYTGTLVVPEGGVRKIWVSHMGGKKGER